MEIEQVRLVADVREENREDKIRQAIVDELPLELAPAMLRLAFHDAGTYDAVTHTGGANGAIHLERELSRPENTVMRPVVELLGKVRGQFDGLSWADVIAVGGAAAVVKCGGPVIQVGLGRIDATEEAPENRLPKVDQSAQVLKDRFQDMGFTVQEVVVLGGAHTLGKAGGLPFTYDLHSFSNTFYQQLLKEPDAALILLPSDRMLATEPETRPYVELYAADQAKFFEDFEKAYQKLTWLGQTRPE